MARSTGRPPLYDPVTDNTLALAVKGEPVPVTLAAGASALAGTAGAQALAEDSPVVVASVPQQPEFGLAALRASHRYPQEGQAVSVEVGMRNDGVSWAATGTEALRVQATWDGGPGVGAAAGQAQVTSLAAGQAVSVTLALTPPPGGYGREHTLTLTANPGQAIVEISAQNSTLTTPIGGLTPPAGFVGRGRWTRPHLPELDDAAGQPHRGLSRLPLDRWRRAGPGRRHVRRRLDRPDVRSGTHVSLPGSQLRE